jgi:hypothetical protein
MLRVEIFRGQARRRWTEEAKRRLVAALVHRWTLGGFIARGLGLGDALSDRTAEIEHPVEHLNADAGLRPLGGQAPGA